MGKIQKLLRKIRELYWKLRLKKCGTNFYCNSGVTIRQSKKLSIGNNVRIGEKSYLNAKGEIVIGNNVQMGPKVFIWSSNHNYFAPTKLPFDNIDIDRRVTIHDNVWIGAKASIIPGVTIGEGAVIAMCAVVTKDIPPCAVVGGNPAKILKYRNIEVYNNLKNSQ